jgi:hypothetical protein
MMRRPADSAGRSQEPREVHSARRSSPGAVQAKWWNTLERRTSMLEVRGTVPHELQRV